MIKKFNNIQQWILGIGILLFIIIAAFPPWHVVSSPDYSITQSIGYGFITRPPDSHMGYESYVVINYGRLFLQWAGLALLTWVGIWVARKK